MLADQGIDADLIAVLVNFVAMGWRAGRMLIGLDTSIDPLTGFRALLACSRRWWAAGQYPGPVVARCRRRGGGAVAAGVAAGLSHGGRFLAILLVLTLRRAHSCARRIDGKLSGCDGVTPGSTPDGVGGELTWAWPGWSTSPGGFSRSWLRDGVVDQAGFAIRRVGGLSWRPGGLVSR